MLAGGRDLALVLLPLLNDLRAVRGSALLSEGTLLLLNLKSDKQAQPVPAAPGEPPLTVEQWARRLRARFQVGLIGWIRGERIEQNLDILAAVAQKLEQIATRQPVFQLWWVIGAIIEALQENGLEGGVSVKRLLGLADREIRRLYEQGEARYAQSPAGRAAQQPACITSAAPSPRDRASSAVRASFRLSELLPVDESIEQERENLSAPSVKLMQTVAAAIREDLSKVKDVLDIFVRRGAGPAEGAGSAGRAAAQDRRHARRAGSRRAARQGAGARPSASRRSSRASSSPTKPRWSRSPRRSSASRTGSTTAWSA